jgi:hypothetical protein
VAVVAGWTGSLFAQDAHWFMPDQRLLPRLLAGPLEPTTSAHLVLPMRSPTRFGRVFEGQVSLGASLAVLRLHGSRSDDVVLLGVGGGVVGRFNLETQERDIISSDWTFSLPLIVRRGGHWLRLQYFHTSAHLGDEYILRFEAVRIPYARDAADGLAYVKAGSAVGVYAGARWAFRVDPPDHERFAIRAGVELTPPASGDLRAYLAADIESDGQQNWTPRLDARLGAWLTPADSYPAVRVEVGLLIGPPFQGQFQDGRTTALSLGSVIGV